MEEVEIKSLSGNLLSIRRTSESRVLQGVRSRRISMIRRCSTTKQTRDSSRPAIKWGFRIGSNLDFFHFRNVRKQGSAPYWLSNVLAV
jgi:hypothetical protein